MARMFLKRTLSGFVPADEPSMQLVRKFKQGEVYRADVVKPRSYQHHKLCFALLNLTYQNQERWNTFETFRKAVAMAAGHTEELLKVDGELIELPKSLSYDSLDQPQFELVFGSMMTVCAEILGMTCPELLPEVEKYVGENYGTAQ